MTTTWPWLPVELIERIIFETWMLPLTAHDRSTFITSSNYVCKTWWEAFVKISSRDVHIPNASYSEYFFRILCDANPLYPRGGKSSPHNCCRSLNFTIDSCSSPTNSIYGEFLLFGDRNLQKMGLALAQTLQGVQELSFLPNLRHVTIEYVDCGFEDIFNNWRLASFPPQVTDLEVKFTYSERTTTRMFKRMCERYRRNRNAQWGLLIRHLSIMGACEEFVGDMVGTCSLLETLKIDGVVRLAVLAPLPSTVHTVTLWPPRTDSREGYIEGLVCALIAGLFTSNRAKMFLEWGPIEQPAWAWLTDIGDQTGVRLVHNLILYI